ncbi:MAG: ATP-binding protein [Deltaproteobacteria bacterium]|nr:ATP-binding protein [Deltaproteobacteria bacterium]
MILYQRLSKEVYDERDHLLQSRAEGVINSIEAYWEAEQQSILSRGLGIDILSKIDNINFNKVAQRWVEERSNDPELLNIMVQIFDTRGTHIISSRNIPAIAMIPRQRLVLVLEGNPHFDTIAVNVTGRQMSFRTLAMPVIENHRVAYIVQVASPTAGIDTTLNKLKLTLFVLLPITVIFTGFIGVILARTSLRPVDKLISATRHITAENLKSRLPLPESKDEIRRLAETFNELLKRLDQSFTLQRQFFEDFAHELKTPLAVLRGEIEVALKSERTTEEYERILSSNLEEVSTISSIVEDLLLLARFDSRVIDMVFEPVNLEILLGEVIDDIKILASEKNISLSLKVGNDMMVQADRKYLRRLFLILLDNAIKFTGRGGAVSISVNVHACRVAVSVQDTGIGISVDDMPRLFERFYCADKSRSHKGFGLGLSIAKSIAEAHGGIIEVESVPGHGSTFTVTLPFVTVL